MKRVGTIRISWRSAALAVMAAVGLSASLFCSSVLAQVSSYGDKQMGPANDKPPAILNGVSIAQNLNQQLPLSLTFTDDEGKQVVAVPLTNGFVRTGYEQEQAQAVETKRLEKHK